LRNSTNYTWNNSANYSLDFAPNFTDESYGLLKNFTLIVYNPNYPDLNDSVNWKVNVSYENQNVTLVGRIPDMTGVAGTATSVDMNSYFEDADYWDENKSQVVNFTIETVSGSEYFFAGSSFSDWILSLYSPEAANAVLTITAHEYNSSGAIITNTTSESFGVNFSEATAAVVVTAPSTGGGSKTKYKHFSLRLIIPQDIVISAENYIEVPFSVENDGIVALKGIDLSGYVQFNNMFSDDVQISLKESHIDELKLGEMKNYTMRIDANTQIPGKYKATLLANVTSPKFCDYADFFIEIQEINQSQAGQMLVFTEKLIAENPECLELTEIIREARKAFDLGEYTNSLNLAREAVNACEDAIEKNEQILHKVTGIVRDNFYYISFATLMVFFAGFVFYVYKRVRFNKYRVDDYV